VYPRDEVYQYFDPTYKPGTPTFLDSFFQSQPSYMMALAITLKPQKIGLWGIDMAAADEYGTQRPGMHFFIIEAKKRGIEVVAAAQSDILQPIPAYAFKEFSPMYWREKARKIELMN